MDAALVAIIHQEIRECARILQQKYGVPFDLPRVEINSRKTRVWGRATTKPYEGKRVYVIEMSSRVFTRDSNAFRNTIRHEVAHIADHQIYKKWGHGRTWKSIMRVLGCEPNRCATAEEIQEIGRITSRRPQARYVYTCGCREHLMSEIRHSRAKAGTKYSCQLCNGQVIWNGQRAAV